LDESEIHARLIVPAWRWFRGQLPEFAALRV